MSWLWQAALVTALLIIYEAGALHYQPLTLRKRCTNRMIKFSFSIHDTAKPEDGPHGTDVLLGLDEKIVSLALPALVALSIDPVMSLVDTALVAQWAGSNNPGPIASMGSASAILTFAFYICNFLCTASTPLISTYRAQGETKQLLATAGQALSLAIIIGLFLTLLLNAAALPFLQFMGADGAGTIPTAAAFLQIRALAAPAVLVAAASTGILRGFMDTLTPLYILIAANVVNASLDAVLIFGLNWGSTGAAIATSTAEWTAALLLLNVLRTAPNHATVEETADKSTGEVTSGFSMDAIMVRLVEKTESPLRSFSYPIVPVDALPTWNSLQPLLSASTAIFLRTVVLQATLTGAAALASGSGVAADEFVVAGRIGAHQVAIQLWLLCAFVADALAAAAQTLIADAIGKTVHSTGSSNDAVIVANRIFNFSWRLGTALTAVLALGLFLPPHGVPYIFTRDGSTVASLLTVLPMIILSQPVNSLVFAADGVLQGARDFRFQAQSMLFSVAVAASLFCWLQQPAASEFNAFLGSLIERTDALLHVILARGQESFPHGLQHDNQPLLLAQIWLSLIMLQVARGVSALVRLSSESSPLRKPS